MLRVIRVLEQRGIDDYGAGYFGAPRGSRRHRGIDYRCVPGDRVFSPVAGAVTKLGYCYSSGFGAAGEDNAYRYVEVTDADNARHRVLYVSPHVYVNQLIDDRTIIGSAQDICLRYHERKMTPHVHYEIIADDVYVDPEKYRRNTK